MLILFNFEGLSEELGTLKGIYGGVAQLGEHLLCKQGVVSSSLIISTRVAWPSVSGGKCGRNGPIAQQVRARA